jgi:hypothetical protein
MGEHYQWHRLQRPVLASFPHFRGSALEIEGLENPSRYRLGELLDGHRP